MQRRSPGETVPVQRTLSGAPSKCPYSLAIPAVVRSRSWAPTAGTVFGHSARTGSIKLSISDWRSPQQSQWERSLCSCIKYFGADRSASPPRDPRIAAVWFFRHVITPNIAIGEGSNDNARANSLIPPSRAMKIRPGVRPRNGLDNERGIPVLACPYCQGRARQKPSSPTTAHRFSAGKPALLP